MQSWKAITQSHVKIWRELTRFWLMKLVAWRLCSKSFNFYWFYDFSSNKLSLKFIDNFFPKALAKVFQMPWKLCPTHNLLNQLSILWICRCTNQLINRTCNRPPSLIVNLLQLQFASVSLHFYISCKSTWYEGAKGKPLAPRRHRKQEKKLCHRFGIWKWILSGEIESISLPSKRQQ